MRCSTLAPQGTSKNIHDRLICLRIQKKFTILEIAQCFGVNKSTALQWEIARYWLDLTDSIEKRLLLLQLAELYWVDYAWLADGNSNRKSNVMVIDDPSSTHAISNLILKNSLGDKLAVHKFSCTETALAWTKDNYARFILCDYNLPGENTAGFIRTLHEQVDYQTTPIVILTSDDSDETRKNCLDAGAQAVIHKPLEMEALQSLCQQYLPVLFDSIPTAIH